MFDNFVNPFTIHRDPSLNSIEILEKTFASCHKTKVLIIAAAIALLSVSILLSFAGPIGMALGILLGATILVVGNDSYQVINNIQQVCDGILKLKQEPYLQTKKGIRDYIALNNTLVAKHFFELIENLPDPDPKAYQRIFGNNF